MPVSEKANGVCLPWLLSASGVTGQVWRDYAVPWTAANHLRGALSVLSAVALGLGLRPA